MAVVAATEFARNFRVYNLQAQSEPVKVTNHGKVDGAYISARDLEILENAKRVEQERKYVFTSLLTSAEQIKNGELISSEQFDANIDALMAKWDEDDAKVGK